MKPLRGTQGTVSVKLNKNTGDGPLCYYSNGIVIARNETVYVKYTWFNNMSIQVGRGWQAFYQIRNRTVRENLFGHNSVFYINLSDFMKLIVSFAFSKKLAGS